MSAGLSHSEYLQSNERLVSDYSYEPLTELFSVRDAFYRGVSDYRAGKGESEVDGNFTEAKKEQWLKGFRIAAERAEKPLITFREYKELREAAIRAVNEDRLRGTSRDNPYCAERYSERHYIWEVAYGDTKARVWRAGQIAQGRTPSLSSLR